MGSHALLGDIEPVAGGVHVDLDGIFAVAPLGKDVRHILSRNADAGVTKSSGCLLYTTTPHSLRKRFVEGTYIECARKYEKCGIYERKLRAAGEKRLCGGDKEFGSREQYSKITV